VGIARHVRTDMDAERAARSIDAAIAALAARQHGVVSRRQLSGLGIGRGAIDHRLAAGRLHALHRGVFAVGHTALAREARWMAAVLAAGDGAMLSHRAAGALWGVRGTAAARVDVTVPRRRRTRAGLRVHETALQPDEVTIHRGIPVTDPARTLLDLAAVLRPHQLESAVNEAEHRRLAGRLSLEALLARYPGRKGTAALRAIVEARAIGRTRPRSDLEAAFLAVVDGHGLLRPATNRMIELPTGWVEADAVWSAQRLVVELDGYATHGTRHAFEDDRAEIGRSGSRAGAPRASSPAGSRPTRRRSAVSSGRC
jgi:Transcriptional regulator, AbiEi antitoxin